MHTHTAPAFSRIHVARMRVTVWGLLIAMLLALLAAGPAQAGDHSAQISIPSIGVDAPVVPVFVRSFADGSSTWDVSGLRDTVGFFEGTFWFGQGGNVVLGGHSERARGRADVFYDLENVQIGDEVIVTESGCERHYRVTEIYRVSQYDLGPIYPTMGERLTIMTCDLGSYHAASGTYTDRLIVIAVPA